MRNKFIYLGGASAVAMMAMSGTAHAQSQADTASPVSVITAEDLQEMQNDMATLQQQMQALEARAAAAEAKAEAAEAKAATASSGGIKWKGAPQFKDGDVSFKVRGRLQYDFVDFGEPDGYTGTALDFNSELRRGRLGVEGALGGGFGYKAELEFEGGEANFTDAYLSYEAGPLEFIVGQHNDFQSLEELTSSLDTSLMERAAFTDAFDFGRKVGISAQYGAGDFTGQAGIFFTDINSLPDTTEDDNVGFAGRVVFHPKLGENTQLHLGASYGYTDFGDDPESVRYRQRPFLHATSQRFMDTANFGAMPADSEEHYGLEAAVIAGPFHAAGEAHWLDTDLDSTGIVDEFNAFGGYAEVGYFLTGESRGYSSSGKFKGPKILKPVSEGGSGAIQLVARYDYLDLNDDDVAFNVGEQNAFELGVSWWPIDYIRFMANYGHVEYDDAELIGGDTDYSVDVFGARAQVSF